VKARPPHSLHAWFALLSAILLLGCLALETSLAHATLRARATLDAALARAPLAASEEAEGDDAPVLVEARRRLARHDQAAAASLLGDRAEVTPTPETRALAAQAATAAGAFDEAARHATFARRLAPGDAARAEAAEDAVDRALLAHWRPPLRVAAAGGLLFLLVAGARSCRSRRRRRRLAAWVSGLDARLSVRADGAPLGDGSALAPGARNGAVDVFLRPRGTGRPPRPGPTLALVLSHAASNTTLRLTPRHDVRADAVRVPLKDATLARILARPGAWRLEARMEGHPVGWTRLAVADRTPAQRLHLLHR